MVFTIFKYNQYFDTMNFTNSSKSISQIFIGNVSTFRPKYGWTHIYITSGVLVVLILCTVIGNSFVIAAILLEKNLLNVSNYLIISLAVADLMVASLVMSLSVFHEISEAWFLGLEICDLWVCFDVLCCSASILHLVAIAIDRYMAVTKPDYVRTRTAKRIYIMIAIIWLLSIMISVPTRFHLNRNYTKEMQRVVYDGKCLINDEIGFTVFSTFGAFYLPMFFIIGIYTRIYQVARARIRRQAFRKRLRSQHHVSKRSQPCICKTGFINSKSDTHIECGNNGEKVCHNLDEKNSLNSCNNSSDSDSCCFVDKMNNSSIALNCHQDSTISYMLTDTISMSDDRKILNSNNRRLLNSDYKTIHINHLRKYILKKSKALKVNENLNSVSVIKGPTKARLMNNISTHEHRPSRMMSQSERMEYKRQKLEQKRERKAVRTLAIITGCFIVCWQPFFIQATIVPFCGKKCQLPPLLSSFVLWLGYCNSLLNPVIYTIFSPDFRDAFHKILFGRYLVNR